MRLAAINAAGLEAGNAQAVQGRSLPLLQDTEGDATWAAWGATWRDVMVLGPKNELQAVYSLSLHDLNDPANSAALKQLLLDAR